MIVADTNLVVYLLIPGENTNAAESIRKRDPRWISPPLFRYELLNVLAFYVRSDRLDRDDAVRLYRRGLAMVKIDDFTPDAVSVFNLSQSSGCSTYDLEFVALAMHRDVSLVTADQQIIRAFRDITTDLTQVKT